MKKNILIIGAPRTGKSTLAKKIVKELGYSIISIDDLISGFSAFPKLGIKHNLDDYKTSEKIAPFLNRYFKELSEGSIFYDDIKYVIEGTHIDLDTVMPFLQDDKYKKKYLIIGLTFNDENEEDIYKYIKKYDTEDEWTYWRTDEELKGDIGFFITRNEFFNKKFKEYNIKTFDTSHNRDKVLDEVVSYIKKNNK